jgi:hypothetical protein
MRIILAKPAYLFITLSFACTIEPRPVGTNCDGGCIYPDPTLIPREIESTCVDPSGPAGINCENPDIVESASNLCFSSVSLPTHLYPVDLPSPTTDLSAGGWPQGVTGGDFNGDGFGDIATAVSGLTGIHSEAHDDAVNVFFGQGNGVFAGPFATPVGRDANNVKAADLNQDGALDLVVNSQDNFVSVLLNNGQGVFERNDFFVNENGGPISVVVADLNQDGSPDVAALSFFPSDRGLGILLNDGQGNFSLGETYLLNGYFSDLIPGDFNGDGVTDLAITSQDEAGTLGFLLNQGDGSFDDEISFVSQGYISPLVSADINQDGLDDLIANNSVGSMMIFHSQGQGFEAPQHKASDPYMTAMTAGDIDNDGDADLIQGSILSGLGVEDNIVILLNQDGNLSKISYTLGENHHVLTILGDLNGDSMPDIALASGSSERVNVMLSAPCQDNTDK